METISLKLEGTILQEIDRKLAKHRYSTRTEFIRDAIREKLSEIERDEFFRTLKKLKGSSKRKTTNAERKAAGEAAFDELERAFMKERH